jgi:hypothetical protein
MYPGHSNARGNVRCERADVVDGDRIALGVIQGDGHQEDHRHERNPDYEIAQNRPLVLLCFRRLGDESTPDHPQVANLPRAPCNYRERSLQ